MKAMTAAGIPSVPTPTPVVSPPAAPFVPAYPVASLVTRFGAAIVDLLILLAIALVVAIPLGIYTAVAALSFGGLGPWAGVLWGPFALLTFVVWILYFSYFESTSGQTVGKRLLHLRVVSLRTARPPDFTHALVRSVLRIVDWLPALYLVGFLVALVTPQKQRLGDLIAETLVVRA